MRNHRTLGAALLLGGVATVATAAPAQQVAPAPAPPPAAAPAAPSAPAPSPAPAAPAAPPAPASPATPAAPAAPRPAPSASALANAADVRQGVVRLERAGRSIGMGAVLRSDGRILSALSALGHGNFIEARFADGSTLGLRVVHTERAWDLALLAPEGGHWTLGVRPSVLDRPAAGSVLHRFRARGGRLEEGAITVSGVQTVLGRDGAMLSDVILLSTRLGDDELGAPLFDERGEVAAIAVQACAPAGASNCQLGAFGAPVSALKQFLRKAPPREPLPAAWLGFRGVAAHEGSVAGVRILTVDPNGPAARAGLRGEGAPRSGSSSTSDTSADLIVAVQDAPVTTPEEMRDAINRFALSPPSAAAGGPTAAQKSDATQDAGERRVRLLVFGSGKFREVSLPVRGPRQLPEGKPAAPAPPVPAAPTPPPTSGASNRQPSTGSEPGVPREHTPAPSTRI